MPSIDMPLEQLRQYKPSLYREADFQSFWDSTVNSALAQPLNAELIPYNLPSTALQCYAVRFDGFEGGRIAGWFVRPKAGGTFPGVCWYHGYSGRAMRPLDLFPIAAQGVCVLSMDTRGQNGESDDATPAAEGHALGWMTKGIRSPRTYYYRYVYADAVAVCGGAQLEADTTDVLANPGIVVEVLSPSTEKYDRSEKWEAYQRLSSLTDYLLVAQTSVRACSNFV